MTALPGEYSSTRSGAFAATFIILALVEWVRPRRVLTVSKFVRWRTNLTIMVLDTVLIRLLLPLPPVALAVTARNRGWGVFNAFELSGWAELVASLLLLDLIIYFQHRTFHRMPLLWRCHRMHHTDLDLDVSSGNRFHPLEMFISAGIKSSAVVGIGCSPLSLLLFEILLNATSLFNHANMGIPRGLDKFLRLFVVTPDMHRVHHSVKPRETNSNYGFNLPWWDRLFGTYQAQPLDGHEGMTIGLREYRDPEALGVWRLLRNPFTSPPAGRKA